MDKKYMAWTPENVLKLRKDAGLTRFDVFKRTGINSQNIKFWELAEGQPDHRKPGLASMAKMGQFYGLFFYADWENTLT